MIGVGIFLTDVGNQIAVIIFVEKSVIVGIRIADIADAVAIDIGLIGIESRAAIVQLAIVQCIVGIAPAVAVAVVADILIGARLRPRQSADRTERDGSSGTSQLRPAKYKEPLLQIRRIAARLTNVTSVRLSQSS